MQHAHLRDEHAILNKN